MQLKRLSLTNVRVFEQAEFDFHPGMNLLVGVNGAGKSTVLDVLRIMFSQTLPQFTAATRAISIPFDKDDITYGRAALTAKLEFETSSILFEHLVHIPREEYIIDVTQEGQVRDQTYDLIEHNTLTPNKPAILKPLRKQPKQPLVIYFSPYRSLPNMQDPEKLRTSKSQVTASFRALVNNRGLHLREIAQWWLVQESLSKESDDRQFTRYLRECFKSYVKSYFYM